MGKARWLNWEPVPSEQTYSANVYVSRVEYPRKYFILLVSYFAGILLFFAQKAI